MPKANLLLRRLLHLPHIASHISLKLHSSLILPMIMDLEPVWKQSWTHLRWRWIKCLMWTKCSLTLTYKNNSIYSCPTTIDLSTEVYATQTKLLRAICDRWNTEMYYSNTRANVYSIPHQPIGALFWKRVKMWQQQVWVQMLKSYLLKSYWLGGAGRKMWENSNGVASDAQENIHTI